MKAIKLIIILFVGLSMALSCKDVIEEVEICDETGSAFQSLYQSIVATGLNDGVGNDVDIHEYTFKLSADKTLCKIGYQNHSDDNGRPYLFQIYDNDLDTLLYSDVHVFFQTHTSYVTPIDALIKLKKGVSYSISRNRISWGSNDGITPGRVITDQGNSLSFPFQNNDLTITGARCYQRDSASSETGIPFIDMILE